MAFMSNFRALLLFAARHYENQVKMSIKGKVDTRENNLQQIVNASRAFVLLGSHHTNMYIYMY